MPFSRHFLPEHNFLLTRVWGPITDDEVVANVEAINREAAEHEALLELGDTRGLVSRDLKALTVRGVLEASRLEQGQKRAVGGRLAILAKDKLIFGFARAYTALSSQFRGAADTFDDLAEALEWLGLAANVDAILAFIADAERLDRARPDFPGEDPP